jgi:SAM-dependent methyltransferase
LGQYGLVEAIDVSELVPTTTTIPIPKRDDSNRPRPSLVVSVGVAFLVVAAFGTAALQRGRGVDASELDRIIDVLEVDSADVVADVGAGDGRFAAALSSVVGPHGHVYATEVDSNDVERIERRVRDESLSNVTVITGTARDTGLPAGCCDAVLLRRVYHHFTDPEAMSASLRRTLTHDGLLLVIDFDNRSEWGRPSGIPDSREGHGIGRALLRSEMEKAGFEVVADMDWRGGDYAVLFRLGRVID